MNYSFPANPTQPDFVYPSTLSIKSSGHDGRTGTPAYVVGAPPLVHPQQGHYGYPPVQPMQMVSFPPTTGLTMPPQAVAFGETHGFDPSSYMAGGASGVATLQGVPGPITCPRCGKQGLTVTQSTSGTFTQCVDPIKYVFPHKLMGIDLLVCSLACVAS
jgi:hypothetical protein